MRMKGFTVAFASALILTIAGCGTESKKPETTQTRFDKEKYQWMAQEHFMPSAGRNPAQDLKNEDAYEKWKKQNPHLVHQDAPEASEPQKPNSPPVAADDDDESGSSDLSNDAIAKQNDQRGAPWEYDAGPDVKTQEGYRFAEILAKTPNYRSIGQTMLGGKGDKFRWQFGPMFYRGRTGKNQVKVLIIGQEGAQDENVSDRSFTGGTGGRMQNMLHAMGIDRSYLFINTFVYTIQGQYADYAPMMIDGRVVWRNLLTPGMLHMAQDPRSPIVQHRHQLIDHIIEANRDSLKMIIAVGGAAQDSLSTYIMAKGGNCEPQIADASRIQLLKYGSASAGGNKRFFFPVDENGRNLLLQPGETANYQDAKVQEAHKQRAAALAGKFVKLKNGHFKNGLVDLRQTTLDLTSCEVKGRPMTMQGLQGIPQDIRFIGVQHPGSNSPTLEAKFTAALQEIASWNGSSWRLDPDPGMNQPFHQGFRYAHKPVPRRDFRFGLPDVIGLGSTNTTRRDSGTAIEFGSRDAGQYIPLKDAYVPSEDYLRTDVPNEPNKTQFTTFDAGPGERWARIFTENLPVTELANNNPTSALKFGASAIYRGRPDSTEVLVLADQTSHDDMWVGRALMGLEGQKLQAFLQGIGAGLNYTIIRTLPVDTLGASSSTQSKLLQISQKWRNRVLENLIRNTDNKAGLKLILTLGPQADQAIQSVQTSGIPVVSLTGGYGQAFQKIQSIHSWNKPNMRLYERPIPIAREDIPYGMRRWTGTSGDRVARAQGAFSGKLYKVIAPQWATRGPVAQPKPMSQFEKSQLQLMSY